MSDKSTKHILIIEDNEVLGTMLLNTLTKEGYTVKLVKDGKEGFQQISLFAPDLILLDVVIPNMNGYEILEALNEQSGTGNFPPVIIVSNSGEPVEINKILALGAKDYIIKSNVMPDEILKKIGAQITLTDDSTEENILRDKDFRILVIEDDNFLRDLLSRKLTHEKLNLLVAADGEEGIELATNEHPSIILLDLILPGMNGFEVLTQLRANAETMHIPIIILSNLGQESDIEKAKKIGADEFLIKSNFSIDEVISKMKKLVQEKRASGGVVPQTSGTAPQTTAQESNAPEENAQAVSPDQAATPEMSVPTPSENPVSPPPSPAPADPLRQPLEPSPSPVSPPSAPSATSTQPPAPPAQPVQSPQQTEPPQSPPPPGGPPSAQ